MDRDKISIPYSKITHICSYGKKKGQPFASTGGEKTEETASAIASGEVTAEQEAWLCVNQLDPSMPQGRDKAAEYQAAASEQKEAFQRRQQQYLNGVRS